MDVFLELEPTVMKQVKLRLDGVATNGSYCDDNANKQTYLGAFGNTSNSTVPLRIALGVGRITGTEFFFASACYREPWLTDYNGNTNMVGVSQLSDHAYLTRGAWCRMQTLDLAPNSGTVSWSNVRLLGMRRP